MKVINYHDVKPIEEVKGVTRREVITAEDGAPLYTMRVFEVETGSATASHSHPWEHEIFVLAGRGIVAGSAGAIPISAESVVYVAPDEAHCFVNSGNEPLRFICVVPLQKD